jgi:small-conductance mechanosensitive channel
MGYIRLRGPLGALAFLIIAIGGFILAVGDVLDVYDAQWKISVPLTLIAGALIWRFALATAAGEEKPRRGWPVAVYLLMKLGMTVALLLGVLGLIGLAYDLYGLVIGNWVYIVLALVLMAAVLLFAMIPERKKARARRAAGRDADPGPDDLVS